MWPWKFKEVENKPEAVRDQHGLPEPKITPVMPEVQAPKEIVMQQKAEISIRLIKEGELKFTTDIETKYDVPDDFEHFLNWVQRPRGPKSVSDGFYKFKHIDGFYLIRHSQVSGVNVRFFEVKKP